MFFPFQPLKQLLLATVTAHGAAASGVTPKWEQLGPAASQSLPTLSPCFTHICHFFFIFVLFARDRSSCLAYESTIPQTSAMEQPLFLNAYCHYENLIHGQSSPTSGRSHNPLAAQTASLLLLLPPPPEPPPLFKTFRW